jgi:ADP-dependent NAD(P)H-hydrate dehydratase / NAD(P)H-hydrate epimerase
MKPVLTPEQAASLDREAQAAGVPAVLLMERAGSAVARAAVDLCGGVYGRRAVVVCGKGNNGGDGLVAARRLAGRGLRVSVFLMEAPDGLREPAATNLGRLAEVAVRPRPFSQARLERDLERADVVIDAIFGTGFRGMPEDDWAAAIAAVNASAAAVIAVDIPSGVDGTTGAVDGEAVWADLTVTFGAAKTGAVLLPGAERSGTVRVVDIGFPQDLVQTDVFLTEPSDVAAVMPSRGIDAHKRASGVLVVVAGSRGMTGAAGLIASAAGRIGAGLVIVAPPQGVLNVVQSSIVEATFVPLPETPEGTVSADALDPVLGALERAHALAIGPGLTAHRETAGFVRELVRRCPVPMVIDADGLNAFAGRAGDLLDRASEAVLTPHAGEFGRLSGITAREIESDRLGHVRRLAAVTGAVTLLKGSRTLIAEPGGRVRVNATGSPVLATAGTGDVLTGMIGGLLARGLDPADAAAAGAYLHGLAGLIAGARDGEGTLAGALVERIPQAVDQVVRADPA